MEELQRQYDELLKLEKDYKSKMKSFKKIIKDKNYKLIDGKVVMPQNNKIGFKYDYTYYSRYVGEVGAMHDYGEGLILLDDKSANDLKEAYKEYLENKNTNNENKFLKAIKKSLEYINDKSMGGDWRIQHIIELTDGLEIEEDIIINENEFNISFNIECDEDEIEEFSNVEMEFKMCSEYDEYSKEDEDSFE